MMAARGPEYTTEVLLLSERARFALPRLRRHLAACEYAGAEGQAASMGPSIARAYLFPQRQDWLQEALELTPPNDGLGLVRLLYHSLKDASSAEALAEREPPEIEGLYPLVDRLGSEALPFLREYLDRPGQSEQRPARDVARAYSLLALLPDDQALEWLFSRWDQASARAACLEAARRYPEATARLCPAEMVPILLPAKGAASALPEAAPETWPQVLAQPVEKKSRKRKKLTLEPLEHEFYLDWREGERPTFKPNPDYQPTPPYAAVDFFYLSDQDARAALEGWDPASDFVGWSMTDHLLAKFGSDVAWALPSLLQAQPAEVLPQIQPVGWAPLAALVAAELGHPTRRRPARRWLLRHPEAAAIGLLPALFQADRRAEEGLEILVQEGHGPLVAEVAERYQVSELVTELLETTPLEALPKKLPDLKKVAFYDFDQLPPLVLDCGQRLPVGAVNRLVQWLAISTPDEVYAGIALVREHLTAESRTAFAWALFERWLHSGGKARDDWAFWTLVWLGDSSWVQPLVPMIEAWPGESAHARAVTGLDILGALSTPETLEAVCRMAYAAHYRGLRKAAMAKLEVLARERGLATEQLADRCLPGGELEPAWLEWQSRDEPDPDVAELLLIETQRLEQAMCNRRRFKPEEFRDYILAHNLAVALARHLVWATYEQDRPQATFRIAEDNSLADLEDNPFQLDDEATVGLIHPLEYDPSVARGWGEIFADYQLLQPFEQLGRQAFATSHSIDGYLGRQVPQQALLELLDRGWSEPPTDSPLESLVKGDFELGFSPGIFPAKLKPAKQHSLSYFKGQHGLDRFAHSEVVRDLEFLTSG